MFGLGACLWKIVWSVWRRSSLQPSARLRVHDVLQIHHLRGLCADQTVDIVATGVTRCDEPALGVLDLSEFRRRQVATENREIHSCGARIELAQVRVPADSLLGGDRRLP